MMGKYSPAVQGWYHRDQKWHKEVDGIYDQDGYDSYGYDKNDADRAGLKEFDYSYNEELFHRISSEWWRKDFPY